MLTVIAVMCVLSAVAARSPYQFSDGYLEVLGGEPNPVFSCDDRPYGYYADAANDCKVFHVCLPVENYERQSIDVLQFSFFCGNQTVFNQESLTCAHPEDALPCQEAESFYQVSNAEFGVIPDETNEREIVAA